MASITDVDPSASIERIGYVQGPWDEQLKTIKESCKAVGSHILQLRAAGLKEELVTLPNGKKVVQTNADIEASQRLIEKLSKAYPKYGLISQDQMEKDPTWYQKEDILLINPIDNTKLFAKGDADFHIQIGLLHRDKIVVGVSYYPATERFVWAVEGQGAWSATKNEAPKRLEVRPSPQNILLKSTSHEIIAPLFEDFQAKDHNFSSTNRLLDMIDGHSNLYISLGASPQGKEKKGGIWNYGANDLIAKEAGLTLTTLRGTPLNLRQPDALLSEGVVLTSNPALIERVAKTFKEEFQKVSADSKNSST